MSRITATGKNVPLVYIALVRQAAVGGPSVSNDDRAFLHNLLNKALETHSRNIRNFFQPYSTKPFGRVNFHCDCNNGFCLGLRPCTPSSSPPTYVSSISTRPLSISLPGRTITRRNLCNQVHAV